MPNTTKPEQALWPVPNEIEMYFHCKKCMDEKPPHKSPQQWGRYEAGWTKKGLQVWCKRHNINIMHVDFEKTQHPAICLSHMNKDDYATF